MFETIRQFVIDQLQNNQFAQGGMLLGAFGIVVGYLRYLPGQLWKAFDFCFCQKLDVNSTDGVFLAIVYYLSLNKGMQKSKRTRVIDLTQKRYRFDVHIDRSDDEDRTAKIMLIPADGVHWFFHQMIPCILTKSTRQGQGEHSVMMVEEIKLKFLTRKKSFVYQFIEDAKDEYAKLRVQNKSILTPTEYADWTHRSKISKRSIDSVVLKDDIQHKILDSMKSFFGEEERYTSLGIPYRRGYLFYGPSGQGKTSMIKALASELNTDLYVVSINDKTTDSTLLECFSSVKSHSIVVLEDIDGIFKKRELKNPKMAITFSGLLNALDGLGSSSGYVFIATCNNIEDLDEALIRPGRIDEKIYFDRPNEQMLSDIWHLFFKDGHPDIKQDFICQIMSSDNRSMSQAQSVLIDNLDSPEKIKNGKKDEICEPLTS